MDTSKFSLGSPNDPKNLGAFPPRRWWCFRGVPVQRLHDRDPRQHFRPVALGNKQQRFHRDLPIACSAFGSAVMYSAASRKVNSGRPADSRLLIRASIKTFLIDDRRPTGRKSPSGEIQGAALLAKIT
jgi:hypothetical protein